ncbi:sigma-70 family RNA polymerase sigma factor [uncultured Flavonifractor sp.]|uniref:sigma-70 family RNA polymerase sigma factor n=1 Tax=uncultured Flavonifractor sp. TaxID=1193534 RepID=UPI00262F5F0E|nr:sigma-70 family RNA polymerase sigma factor [uncultured Flavonifractor sp.]
MENEGKKYTLKIRGKEVEVSEEVYREYIRPVQAEQRQKRRDWKCKLISGVSQSGKRHYVRCNKRCESCPYYLSGQNTLGNTFSLDKIIDEGVELRAFAKDIEADYIEEENIQEERIKLYKAIRQLTPRQQEVVRLVYFQDKTQEEVAEILGVAQSTISVTLERAIENLKKMIRNFP